MRLMKRTIAAAAVLTVITGGVAIGWSVTAQAAGSSSPSVSRTVHPDFAPGKRAVETGNYRQAIEHLARVVADDPRNADALNYLGYSHRKLGEFEPFLDWYQKALAVDPDHRGANEYLGELYLQMGDLAKAEDRLSRLDRICTFGCDEYDELKEAIEAHKAGRAAKDDGW